MEEEKPPPGGASTNDADEVPQGAFRLVSEFFLVPLLVVVVCVGIFFLFSLLTFDHKTPADYLAEVRSGGANQRWQSAFELSRAVVHVAPGPPRQKLARETLEVFVRLRSGRPDDEQVKRYLALVLGRLQDASAIPALEESAKDPDSLTRLYSVWALGMLGDKNAVPTILSESQSEDPGARKMAAYVLGKLGDRRAVERLTAMTADHAPDVRWNAAIALAEFNDASGKEVLHSLLDRAAISRQAPAIRPAQIEEVLLNGLKAEALLKDRDALPAIDALEKSDESLKVRDTAREAARAIRGAP